MQVWNVVRAARWKCRTQQFTKNSPSRHHCTTLLGYIFATKACIDNRKKLVKQQYLLHMSPQYGELRLTSGWDWFGCLGHPCKFQWVRVLAALLHSTLVVGVSQTLRYWTEGATLFGRAAIMLTHISRYIVIWYSVLKIQRAKNRWLKYRLAEIAAKCPP